MSANRWASDLPRLLDMRLSEAHLTEMLAFMQEHGSSVILNWGEDTGQWECSWITSGERHVGIAGTPWDAGMAALRSAVKAAGQ